MATVKDQAAVITGAVRETVAAAQTVAESSDSMDIIIASARAAFDALTAALEDADVLNEATQRRNYLTKALHRALEILDDSDSHFGVNPSDTVRGDLQRSEGLVSRLTRARQVIMDVLWD